MSDCQCNLSRPLLISGERARPWCVRPDAVLSLTRRVYLAELPTEQTIATGIGNFAESCTSVEAPHDSSTAAFAI